jgi:hypothetical protein
MLSAAAALRTPEHNAAILSMGTEPGAVEAVTVVAGAALRGADAKRTTLRPYGATRIVVRFVSSSVDPVHDSVGQGRGT